MRNPKLIVTASNTPSANGSFVASPAIFGTSRCAPAFSIPTEKSHATHHAPGYGSAPEQSLVLDQDAGNADLAGRVIEVDGVARLTVDAIEQNRLYVLPHEESRASIRRRFERIDRTFEQQPSL